MGRSRRHVRLLTARELAEIPACDEACLRGSAYAATSLWARSAMRRWGFVGVRAGDDAGAVTVLIAPGLHVPPRHPVALSAAADECTAVVLAVTPGELGTSSAMTARLALEGLVARLKSGPGKVRTLEVRANAEHPTCLTPELSLLERCGFRPVETGEHPLCRLDLRASIVERWAETSRNGLRGLRPVVSQPQAGMRETL